MSLTVETKGTKMQRLITVLTSTLAISVIGCSTALAAPVWEVNGSPVTGNVTIKSKGAGEMQLEDTKTPTGPATIQCSDSGEGTVGTGGKGKITAVSVTGCKGVRGCESAGVTVKALNLPWNTQIVEAGGEARVKITNGGSGAPTWGIECLVLGLTIKDECSGEPSLDLGDESGGVDVSFDAKTVKDTCSIGGAGTGVASGTILLESPSSGKLVADYAVNGDGIQIRPFQWVFGEGKEEDFLIVNLNWFFKEEVVSGKLSSAGTVFEVKGGQGCYNTNVEYLAGESCEVLIKAKGKSKEKEDLEVMTKSEGTRTANFEV